MRKAHECSFSDFISYFGLLVVIIRVSPSHSLDSVVTAGREEPGWV